MVNILVVDDSKFMRKVLIDILREKYSVVGEAGNGAEGVKEYGILKPDLVLLDIIMPEMDGIAAVKEIKSKDPGAKIVMVTAMGQESMVKQAFDAGAEGYVIKPFQAPAVLKEIEKVLEK